MGGRRSPLRPREHSREPSLLGKMSIHASKLMSMSRTFTYRSLLLANLRRLAVFVNEQDFQLEVTAVGKPIAPCNICRC